jgi:hypothetical protein
LHLKNERLIGPHRKLHPLRYGPYTITKAMGDNSFVLNIPPFLGLHPVFNVAFLWPYFPPLLDTSYIKKMLEHECWNTNVGTRMLEHDCWNTNDGTRLLEHEWWNTNAGTRLLEHECWNTTAGTRMLEHECWNTTAGTRMLEHDCWNTNAGTCWNMNWNTTA